MQSSVIQWVENLLYRRTKEHIYEFLAINRLEDGNFK